jgi:hypothetical protein
LTVEPEPVVTTTITVTKTVITHKSGRLAVVTSAKEADATVTVTTTINEDIFVNCDVQNGNTLCTTASVVDFAVRPSRATKSLHSSKHHRAKTAKKSRAYRR